MRLGRLSSRVPMTDASPSGLNQVVRLGLSRSVVSLLVKVATAGLTYLMYVLLSRTMGDEEYGQFALGLSLATMLAIVASLGQHVAVLRFWPEAEVAGKPEAARRAVHAGSALTLSAGLVVAIGMVAVVLALGLHGDLPDFYYLFGAAILIVPLALADYGSSALRAQGSVWTALWPRDILWRLAVPVFVAVLFSFGFYLSGGGALVITALLLLLALGLQAGLARWRGYDYGPSFRGVTTYWRERGSVSLWFLAGVVVETASLNMDIVLVGLLVDHESAGLYFNAFRTAGLMTLFMFAITLVIAPMVSRHFHAGELAKAQAVVSFCAWAGFGFSLVVFAAFAFFGGPILSLFGTGYAEGYLILVILAVGLLFDAATGPTRVVMMMTGHEGTYVRVLGAITVVGMVVQAIAIPMFGLLGAAIANAATRIVAQVTIAILARRQVGLDTSILGILRIRDFSAQAKSKSVS